MTPQIIQIMSAASPPQLEACRILFQEYVAWLGIDLAYQAFTVELATLPGNYAPPKGRLLLAMVDNATAGCVAMRPMSETVCEMKRLYVRPAFRGRGLGRQLAMRIIDVARQQGYTLMRLDTLPHLQDALRLYEQLGFMRCPAYYASPLIDTIFMEYAL